MTTRKTATKKKSSKRPAERPVLITTKHRGVFFGYARDTTGDVIEIKRCRNVIYWTYELHGFIGLAVTGPNARCRIGPAADGTLRDVTAVLEVKPAAVAAFEKAPWV